MTTGQRWYGCLGKARPQKYDLYIVSSGLGKTDDHCSGSGRLRRHTDGSPSSPHTTQRRMAGPGATYHSCPYSTTAVPHSFLPSTTAGHTPPRQSPILPSFHHRCSHSSLPTTPPSHHTCLHSFLPLQLSKPVTTRVEKILPQPPVQFRPHMHSHPQPHHNYQHWRVWEGEIGRYPWCR